MQVPPPSPFPIALKEFIPLFISSPVTRSGTTLVQRLLTSAPNCLIYGEHCAHDFKFYLNHIAHQNLFFQSQPGWRDQEISTVLAGDGDGWIPDLMPPLGGYLDRLAGSVYSILQYYPGFAIENGRYIWGAKLPGWPQQEIRFMRQAMPQLRVLFVYRDILPCLKSAKAAGLLPGRGEFEQYCRAWVENLSGYLGSGDPLQYTLRYEDLVARPLDYIPALEQFSGALGIKATVMEKKVNTAVQGSEYIPPADLTDEEVALALKLTGGLRDQLYPGA